MDDFHVQDSGLKFIIASGYGVYDLQNFIKCSNLRDKCPYINDTEAINVKQICEELDGLLTDNLSFGEVTSLFVASCMVFLLPGKQDYESRSNLLDKTFRYVDTLNPLHLHIATKCIFEELKSTGIPNYSLNILKISHHISVSSPTGEAIALCLVWAMLYDLAGKNVKMFCFHEFSHINDLLKEIDTKSLTEEDNAPNVYLLLQIIGFLMNAILFESNKEIAKAGYGKYFRPKLRDLQKLKIWTSSTLKCLQPSVSESKKNWHLWMVITDFVNLSICTQLETKIRELSTEEFMDH